MSWFSKLFGRAVPPQPSRAADPEAAVRAVCDDETITVRHPGGRVETIAWSALARVTIATTDAGPFVTDLFWLLEDSKGHRSTLPMGAAGEKEFLKAMQRRLEGFDNMTVVEAMGSTEVARFVVWEADS